MNREAILDKGERVFVLTVAMILGAEALFTVMATGLQFAWPRLLLGVFGSVFIIFLAQRLFAGDRGIVNVALAWAGFQIVLLAASLVIGPEPQEGALGIVQAWGTPVRYMAFLKLLAYASFAAVLLMPSCALAFLADRRGDDIAKFVPAAVADEGGEIAWNAEQLQRIANLTGWMFGAAVVLIGVGACMVVGSIPPSLRMAQHQGLTLLEGLLLFSLGGLLLLPALGFANIDRPDGKSHGDLKDAVRRLACWHLAAGAIGVAWACVVVMGFLIS